LLAVHGKNTSRPSRVTRCETLAARRNEGSSAKSELRNATDLVRIPTQGFAFETRAAGAQHTISPQVACCKKACSIRV
jgi:hypothetical protein